ncbi:hypothetical protein ABNQ39_20895 [Azospirillum sp. A26]|uniref:hypothetical protein n=1 Tax=Azospirillum sp. A26 TaxID=3160607 RepID=UPI00366C16B8
MADFITLTLTCGKPIRVNMAGILSYERVGPIDSTSYRGPQPERTALISMKSEELFADVMEPPEVIDALLLMAAGGRVANVKAAAHEVALMVARRALIEEAGA